MSLRLVAVSVMNVLPTPPHTNATDQLSPSVLFAQPETDRFSMCFFPLPLAPSTLDSRQGEHAEIAFRWAKGMHEPKKYKLLTLFIARPGA